MIIGISQIWANTFSLSPLSLSFYVFVYLFDLSLQNCLSPKQIKLTPAATETFKNYKTGWDQLQDSGKGLLK